MDGLTLRKAWVGGAVAASCALWGAAAHAAPKVLLLTTSESNPIGASIMQNATASFTAALGAAPTIRRDLSTQDPNLGQYLRDEAFDLVVVMAVYQNAHASNIATLLTAAQQRDFSGLYVSLDTCGNCSPASKVAQLTTLVSGLAGAAYPNVALSATPNQYVDFALNATGAYSSSFVNNDPLRAGWYQKFDNVPADLVLYHTASPATQPNSAHHLIVPGSLSNSGRGACVIATSDGSHFDSNGAPNYRHNTGFGAALIEALSTDSSCKVPAKTPSDLAGRAFDDVNGNGVTDAGEPPLAGVLVQATCTAGDCLQAMPQPVSATSAADGSFAYTGLTNGTWTLSASAPGRVVTMGQVGVVNGAPMGSVSLPAINGISLFSNAGANYVFGLAMLPDVALDAPASVNDTQQAQLSGTTTDAPAGTTVTLVIRDAQGNVVQTLTASTDAAFGYQTPAGLLPAGTYLVEASIPGDPTPAMQALVVVAAPTVPPVTPVTPVTVQPVPGLAAWPLTALGAVLGALGIASRRRVAFKR